MEETSYEGKIFLVFVLLLLGFPVNAKADYLRIEADNKSYTVGNGFKKIVLMSHLFEIMEKYIIHIL